MKQQRGFASAELFIVIALLSLSMAICFPILRQVERHHPSGSGWLVLALPALVALGIAATPRLPECLRNSATLFLVCFGLPGLFCFLKGVYWLLHYLPL
jgi:hypothetical protein